MRLRGINRAGSRLHNTEHGIQNPSSGVLPSPTLERYSTARATRGDCSCSMAKNTFGFRVENSHFSAPWRMEMGDVEPEAGARVLHVTLTSLFYYQTLLWDFLGL